MANKDAFQEYLNGEKCSPYFSDIISALSKNKIDCFADHENDYWEIPTYKEKEIFANMFSVESLFEKDFEYMKNNLRPLYDAYMKLTEE